MAIDFGYFTLSDNYYPDDPRSSSDFVREIREQAFWTSWDTALWIGEHHFDRLGVNSRPDILAGVILRRKHRVRACGQRRRCHHVAEAWATLDLLSGGRVDFATDAADQEEYRPGAVS